MSSTKRNTRRKKPLTPKIEIKPVTEKLLDFIFSEDKLTNYKYILNRIVYLLWVLFMAFIIQKGWNTSMDYFLDGQYQMGLFEAAILWVCVY
jgi:hypothetical protein